MSKRSDLTHDEEMTVAADVLAEPIEPTITQADCQFLKIGYYLVDGHVRDIIEGPFEQKFQAQQAMAARDAACGQGTCALLFVPCDGFAWG